MTRRSFLTVVVAVLGLALSAALAWSASQLAGQRIGLAAEPLSVTQGLAPHHHAAASPQPVRNHARKARPKPAHKHAVPTASPQIFSTSTAAPAPVTPAAPGTTAALPPPATTSAPAVMTTTPSSSPAVGPLPSSGTSKHRDDHHPDD